MLTNLITVIALIIYLLLAWLVGSLMGLTGTRLWASPLLGSLLLEHSSGSGGA